ncbi:MAG: phosphocholine cytidylyltransferase family protein [bacterium]|nr:phosphocholine cytidylyltransferase family protein [bacterium]
MKALILAAGFGSRLTPITNKCPKSMVPVNGTPILFKQIDNLLENDITDITVICGYLGDLLRHAVERRYPMVKVVESKNYATTNNMYSAYIARGEMEGYPFLMMNADVFFDSSVLKALVNEKQENAIVTDVGTYMEESMKVAEAEGRLVEISKEIPREKAFGTSIDVYKFGVQAGRQFFSTCRDYIEKKKKYSMWSEIALNDTLKVSEFYACPLKGRWLEIDNMEDLKAAQKLFV